SSFLPGKKYTIIYDVSKFLDASIHEVILTLIEAFLLVALIVFVFLQDVRATIITAISVPISIIGTFLFMNLFGFSINLLTLFALVLAIGIVVDNAIVVVEAVYAKMEMEHMDSKSATFASIKEIGSAIISITLVMSAVFIPVAFLNGPIGVFYRQFSVTLAISIIISGFVALTLIPSLCATYLKAPQVHKVKHNFIQNFFRKFNSYYQNTENKFISLVSNILNRKLITASLLLLFLSLTFGFGKLIPTGFIPTEDQGVFYIHVATPSGSSLERTEKITSEIEKICSKHKDISGVSSLIGFNVLTDGYGTSYAMCMVNLNNWENRKLSVEEIIEEIKKDITYVKDASIQFFPPPPIPGYGNASGFEFRILDKSGRDNLKNIESIAENFAQELNNLPEIKNTFSSYNASFPQYLLKVDYDKAAQKGIDVENAMSTLQSLVGSFYATNFIKFGQLYKVMVQADPKYRALPSDVLKLYVKNKNGEMVPYSSFVNIEKVSGPEQLTRYNMYLSAMINGEPEDGYSSGDCIEAIKKTAEKKLPKGYTFEWSGFTQDEVESSGQTIYIFIICIVFVYLLLSAQYESFLLPLSVLLSIPTGVVGVFTFLMMFGLDNNVYAQVAMIMLIGLLGKNAILIIEFANQKHKQGATIINAVLEASKLRLRPIIMTSLAFIAGLIPLAMASGAGEIGNKTIGSAAIGGMLFGTVFGLIIIPGLYVLFASIEQKIKTKKYQQ
ncbi:MAG: efflux RND transporter permease subunit, partial [Bacteroidia bacterium]|nr:efflux RND transporter permease subunit [Bacteroidia bacterium]